MRLQKLADSLSESSIRSLLQLKRRARRLNALEAERRRLTRRLAALSRRIARLGAPSSATGKRRLSPAARRRISLAQKRRWAAHRKAKSGG